MQKLLGDGTFGRVPCSKTARWPKMPQVLLCHDSKEDQEAEKTQEILRSTCEVAVKVIRDVRRRGARELTSSSQVALLREGSHAMWSFALAATALARPPSGGWQTSTLLAASHFFEALSGSQGPTWSSTARSWIISTTRTSAGLRTYVLASFKTSNPTFCGRQAVEP